VVGWIILILLACILVGCAPERTDQKHEMAMREQAQVGPERQPNKRVRAKAEKIAKQYPTRCVIEFTTNLSRPWEEAFEQTQKWAESRKLLVIVTDSSEIRRLLGALQASTRDSRVLHDPIEAYALQPHDFIVLYDAQKEVARFHFQVEELRERWGEEVADIIVPIYERETARYMPRGERE
jgi:transposase